MPTVHKLLIVPATIAALAVAGAPGASAKVSAKKAAQPVALNATQQGILDCTNAARLKAGRRVLVADAALTRAAQRHAADMDANHYFDHNSRDGRRPWDRIKAALNGEKPFSLMGENIASGYEDATSTCAGWMNSAPHKANILNQSFTAIGVGWADG